MLVADIFIKTKSYINQPENSHQENNIGCAPFLTSSPFTDWLITWLKSVSSFILSHQPLSIFFNGIFSSGNLKKLTVLCRVKQDGKGKKQKRNKHNGCDSQPAPHWLTHPHHFWKLKTNKHNGCNYEPAPYGLTPEKNTIFQLGKPNLCEIAKKATLYHHH